MIKLTEILKEAKSDFEVYHKTYTSTISIATKKALDIACARILDRMIKKGIFPN